MRRCLAFLAALAGALALAPLQAGDFGVSPIRVDLDRSTRTQVVRVTNDDERPLSFQMRMMEWTQDDEGRDRYADSADLIFFPQQMQVAAKESRVVRLGYRHPPTPVERAYRLYVEELPRGTPPGEPGKAMVEVAVRFGVPVFVRPAVVEEKGRIAGLRLAGGRIEAQVENEGSVHLRLESVTFEAFTAGGEKVFEKSLEGWYLLAGAKRSYAVPFPAEACAKSARLRVAAVAAKLTLRQDLEIRRELCS